MSRPWKCPEPRWVHYPGNLRLGICTDSVLWCVTGNFIRGTGDTMSIFKQTVQIGLKSMRSCALMMMFAPTVLGKNLLSIVTPRCECLRLHCSSSLSFSYVKRHRVNGIIALWRSCPIRCLFIMRVSDQSADYPPVEQEPAEQSKFIAILSLVSKYGIPVNKQLRRHWTRPLTSDATNRLEYQDRQPVRITDSPL